MDDSNQMEQHPTLCRNGCGFYSNNGTDGLCSVCYKDIIKKKQQPPTGMPASLAPNPGSMATLPMEEQNKSAVASVPLAAAAAASSNLPSPSDSSKSSSASSVETAQPTVLLPSTTEKVKTFNFLKIDSQKNRESGQDGKTKSIF